MSVENDDLEGLDNEVDQESVEREARALGWVPQDKFRGDKAKWVDAPEFVDRGKNLMPVLAANNERLKRELLTRDQKIDTLTRKLDGATAAIDRLEDHYTQANKRAVEIAKSQLKEELKQAREDRDVDAEVEILDKLEDLRQASDKKAAPATPTKKDEPSDLSDEFKEWQAENSWYGQDKKRTKQALRIAEDLRDEGITTTGREFMDAVVEKLEEQEGASKVDDDNKPVQRTPSKVDSGNPSGRRSGSVKGWNDLPKDAQQACLSDVDTLVGDGKRYKDVDSWKKQYIKLYFAEG
jgi:hypothetical protein